jgi:ATP-binding cassette subfamily A (ABC1) protein 3
MLTGDEFRSCGNAFAFMNNLDRDRKSFLSNIGYCPQFDGIIGVLTGREMLQLFCRLRGVPGRYGKIEAEKWLNKLGLAESANVQCQKYSGGMKRRLSVAMAMIGDPPLLLLDEPTSGVDPVSRRQFWRVLETVKNKGQSIILTSHSMEECEALCSRLGIMVNGQLQCFGGVQHLKGKFAQGYSLSVKLKPMVPVESESLNRLSAAISEKFAPCTLKDKHQSILQYQLHNASLPWDGIFKSMEDLKKEFNDIIEDYSVNETTLEEVFLSFARMQFGDRKANVSLLKRLITCQC